MTHDFSFADHALHFDQHIRASIPGYDDLRAMCVGMSSDFVQSGTRVLDIGCSSGVLLRSIRDANDQRRSGVEYVGIDVENEFQSQWREREAANVEFRVADARSFEGFQNLSLVTSVFSLQFMPPRDRPSLLRKVNSGLIDGGAFIVAEKVLANRSEFQDLITSAYHADKRRNFSSDEIMDKERALRGVMTPWNEPELVENLQDAGFRPEGLQRFWQNYLFLALIAKKMPAPRQGRS
jgi:tRNA (cmo5U34)-methyltransferase